MVDNVLRSTVSRLLVRHPHVMSRLREEIISVLAGKTELNREDLKKTTYLSNILKESMLI
jgi:septum formation topological specificity factor MinE